ncbi:MAG TPA: porin family protein [Saprospiraceae bacterium]|nr:porin family protein [Saprospiraceae bacterium]
MKFLVAFVLTLIVASTTIKAQYANIGLKAGLNVSTLHWVPGPQDNSRVGYNIGLLAHIHVNPNFGIQPELVYSTQGSTDYLGGTNNSTCLDYVNIPVMFQFYFGYGFRFEVGPQLGILASAKSISDGIPDDISDQLESVDFALGLGLSYVYIPSGFGFDFRYNIGLTDITTDPNYNTFNRGIQLGIFYLINHR